MVSVVLVVEVVSVVLVVVEVLVVVVVVVGKKLEISTILVRVLVLYSVVPS